jgi:hypothetical protein
MTHRSCYQSAHTTSRVFAAYVEVGQDDEQSSILWSKHILGGDLDILKCDIGGTSSSRVRCLDLLGLDSFTSRYKEYSQSPVGLLLVLLRKG